MVGGRASRATPAARAARDGGSDARTAHDPADDAAAAAGVSCGPWAPRGIQEGGYARGGLAVAGLCLYHYMSDPCRAAPTRRLASKRVAAEARFSRFEEMIYQVESIAV